MGTTEVVLNGGVANRGLVVRVGDTVRRPLRPWSTATHALLRHLDDVGFEGAPRVLGIDDAGREVLTFVDGDAATTPLPSWALTDEALRSAAELLRRYHDAVASFDATAHSWGRQPPPPYAGELVSHNDPNTDNVVFRDGRAVALIDFDLASPGSRLWDVASLARLWAPIKDPRDVPDSRRERIVERYRLVANAYGLDQNVRAGLGDAVLANHDWGYDVVLRGALRGDAGYLEYVREGAAERADRSRAWCLASAQMLHRAVAVGDGPPGLGAWSRDR